MATSKTQKLDVFKLPIHPAADVFPMLPKDELQELANDIKTNGLQNPIVIGKYKSKWHLIDGRNRREACKLAKVNAATMDLNGQDPEAYIISANINRRHMNKGQRAMAVAMIYPESTRGRGNVDPVKQAKIVSFTYIKEARTVLREAPDLVESVMSGIRTLTDAYAEAKKRKAALSGDEKTLNNLRDEYPQLADDVEEGRLSLNDALAKATELRYEEKQNREAVFSLGRNLQDVASAFSSVENIRELQTAIQEYNSEWDQQGGITVNKLFNSVSRMAKNIDQVRQSK